MRCDDCPRHDSVRKICRDGKLNPHSWESAVEVAQHLGVRALCVMNDFREEIIEIWGAGLKAGTPPESGDAS